VSAIKRIIGYIVWGIGLTIMMSSILILLYKLSLSVITALRDSVFITVQLTVLLLILGGMLTVIGDRIAGN